MQNVDLSLLSNINTYFSLRAKCWIREGIGGQFPSFGGQVANTVTDSSLIVSYYLQAVKERSRETNTTKRILSFHLPIIPRASIDRAINRRQGDD